MSQETELKERLYKFALSIVKLVRALPREMAGLEMGRQLLRSGTSIAANYEEAAAGFSKEDFIYKLSISFKESKESHLWLRLLRDSGVELGQGKVGPLLLEAEEIAKILAKSLKTSRSNLKQI